MRRTVTRTTLADDLVARGQGRVPAPDISHSAIDAAKARLGGDAARVEWIASDITQAALPDAPYDLWHNWSSFLMPQASTYCVVL